MAQDNLGKEFDDFVYMVSHDMAAPQRHIREFTKLLLASFDGPLSPEQSMYKGFIEQGLLNLERMQAALLNLSRVTTHGQGFVRIDGVECLRQAVIRLGHLINPSGAIITLPDKAVFLSGDAAQIEEMFFALLENALIYVSDGVAPKIDVHVRESDGNITFDIQDNGIGVHVESQEQIFTMFRRLHPAQAYGAGVGAGLAIARKIARRHAGDISVSSDGVGCLFRVSFPL